MAKGKVKRETKMMPPIPEFDVDVVYKDVVYTDMIGCDIEQLKGNVKEKRRK